MKSLLQAARRAFLRSQVRSLEITLQGQIDSLAVVTDPLLRQSITVTREPTRRELARTRAAYIALLPPGARPVFEVA